MQAISNHQLDVREAAHGFLVQYNRRHSTPLPRHEFRLPPNQTAEWYDLVTWDEAAGKKYGVITGKGPAPDAGDRVLLKVTEIASNIEGVDAVYTRGRPAAIPLLLGPVQEGGGIRDAHIADMKG